MGASAFNLHYLRYPLSVLVQLCVTLDDWEAFATKYADATHRDEKTLHRYINKEVMPSVREEFAVRRLRFGSQAWLTSSKQTRQKIIPVIEKPKAPEPIPYTRIKSSRIAMMESETDEQQRQKSSRIAAIQQVDALTRVGGRSTRRAASPLMVPLTDQEKKEQRKRAREERKRRERDGEGLDTADTSYVSDAGPSTAVASPMPQSAPSPHVNGDHAVNGSADIVMSTEDVSTEGLPTISEAVTVDAPPPSLP